MIQGIYSFLLPHVREILRIVLLKNKQDSGEVNLIQPIGSYWKIFNAMSWAGLHSVYICTHAAECNENSELPGWNFQCLWVLGNLISDFTLTHTPHCQEAGGRWLKMFKNQVSDEFPQNCMKNGAPFFSPGAIDMQELVTDSIWQW